MKRNFIQTDRFIREAERQAITSISRTTAWVLEQKGQFPKRRRISQSSRSVGWLLSELIEWIESRQSVK